MKFYVVQSEDKRYDYAARLLARDGHELAEAPEQAEAAVFPMMACRDGVHITGTELIFDDFAARLPENGVIFGWLDRESPRPALNYMVDPSLRYLNAIPTAEPGPCGGLSGPPAAKPGRQSDPGRPQTGGSGLWPGLRL